MNEEFELSEREIDIIRLVATGASNKEIAQKLVISPNTVKVHLRNIFGKLNVVSRTEATMVAIRMGWVDSPKNENSPVESIASKIDLNEFPVTQIGMSRNRRRWIGALVIFFLLLIIGNIYFFIFFNKNQTNNPTDSLPLQNSQRWQKLTPMSVGLKTMAAVRYEQLFYIIGGETNDGISDSVLIYDINQNSWKEGAKKPNAASNIQAAIIGEKIFVPGGINETGIVLKSLEVYDPREDQWEFKADLPNEISRYALVSFEGKIYLFGGWDGQTYRQEVYVYDPSIDSWDLFSKMPQGRADFAATVVGGRIHVFGGRNEEGILDSHDVFVPQRQMDGENPWSSSSPLPQKRFGFSVNVLADMVYIAGGENENQRNLPVIQFLPPKDEWLEIDQPIIPIGNFPAMIPYETRLYIMGGEVNSEVTSTNQVFQAIYTILVPVVR
ncbi:MAG: Kelch repeat-containing protein [Anaerolineaceae bacterium]|nr:MAG: hypothetical protein CVU46_02375 [Chloroflexi bacterium HGW-Chloroflexi-8]